MVYDFTGKVALISGAGMGMGAAAAERFAAAGAAVVLGDVDEAAVQATAARIEAAGGRAIAVRSDVTQESDAADLVAKGADGRARGAEGPHPSVMNDAGSGHVQGDRDRRARPGRREGDRVADFATPSRLRIPEITDEGREITGQAATSPSGRAVGAAMMPNVTHGTRMSGLLSYLVDTDEERTHNVHAEPHLVAGDAAIVAWHDDTELSASDAAEIARQLDVPRRAHGVDVPGCDVWHCSLSLRAEEGQLSDEQWGKIAQQFMDRMDFTDAGGKSPARWVAVRHGLSKNGNDHIHIAASRVREDGTKVSIHNDFVRAQRIARELEQEHGLEPLEGEQTRTAARGYQRAEAELAGKRGQAEPARVTLEREVRAASIASGDEAEFVRRMRAGDVLVRPRYASDRMDVVAGYSVALRPKQGSGEGPVWYGGGRLARDLTLPALRQSWPDTPEAATAAVAEWNAANRHRRVAAPGRERDTLDGKRWDAATQRLQLMNDRLAQIPVQDRGRWAELARDGAGTLAAWSRTAPREMRPQLAQAASALGRSAQLRQAPRRRVQSESPFAGAALVLAAALQGPRSMAAELAMMEQLILFARAMVQMHRAMQDVRTARAPSGRRGAAAVALRASAAAGRRRTGGVAGS